MRVSRYLCFLSEAYVAGGLYRGKISTFRISSLLQDQVVWKKNLETVVKEREGWKDLYRASREVL